MTTAELAKRFLDALATKDIENVMSLWHPQGIMEFPFAPEGSPKKFVGLDTIRATLESSFIQRPEMAFFDVEAFQALEDGLAFVEFKGKMTLKNGAPYNNTYIAKVEASDGKLKHFKEFFNPLVDIEAGNPRMTENQ